LQTLSEIHKKPRPQYFLVLISFATNRQAAAAEVHEGTFTNEKKVFLE
jgi:hypothetical protein